MATLKTILRKSKGEYRINSKGEALVYIQYQHQGKSTIFSTGIKILPKDWKGDKDQSNPISRTRKGYTNLNALINKLKFDTEQMAVRLRNNGEEPTVERLKTEIKILSGSKRSNGDLLILFEDYVKDLKPKLASGTIKGYYNCRFHIISYSDHKNKRLKIGDITLDFYNDFLNYLLMNGLNNNSAGKVIKHLKTFLKSIKKQGVELSIDPTEMKVLREKPQIIYLTQEELNQLSEFDFSKNPKLERVRDLFLLQCSTGLRYSDLSRLGRHHLKGNLIKLKSHKNKNDVLIPLIPMSSKILNKYDFTLPKISGQKFNDYIKEACRLAGIDSIIEQVHYRGGQKVYNKVSKYKLISSHKGVSTFITHCGELGVSAKTVSEITGKTVKVILDHYYGTNEKVIQMEIERAFGSPLSIRKK